MDIEIKPSPLSSFLVGTGVFIPLLVRSHIPFEGFMGNVLLSLTVVGYVLLIVIFVFGPMHWEQYGFCPNDGMEKAVIRGVFWMVGGAASMAIMDLTNAL